MTNSKKDGELEEITKILLSYHDTEPHAYLEAAEVLTHLKSKYITKEESDRRVLEARIKEREEARNIVWRHHPNECEPMWETLADRIAELRELLNGDKEE